MPSVIAIAVLWGAFAGSHLVLSGETLRPRLVARFGLQPFLGVYSLVAAGDVHRARLGFLHAQARGTAPVADGGAAGVRVRAQLRADGDRDGAAAVLGAAGLDGAEQHADGGTGAGARARPRHASPDAERLRALRRRALSW